MTFIAKNILLSKANQMKAKLKELKKKTPVNFNITFNIK